VEQIECQERLLTASFLCGIWQLASHNGEAAFANVAVPPRRQCYYEDGRLRIDLGKLPTAVALNSTLNLILHKGSSFLSLYYFVETSY